MNRLLAIATLVTGVAVLGISQVFVAMQLRSAQPLNGAYGDQAMLAFEFARTPDELAAVIGTDPPSEEAREIRAALDKADRIDFAYMALYGAFIAAACVLAAQARGRTWLLAGVLLGPLAALFDLGENLVLLELTQAGSDVQALLPQLFFRTYVKWELLAVTSALFAAAFIGDRRRWVSIAAGTIAALSLLSGVMTYVNPAEYSMVLLYAIAIVWIWQLGYAAMLTFRKG